MESDGNRSLIVMGEGFWPSERGGPLVYPLPGSDFLGQFYNSPRESAGPELPPSHFSLSGFPFLVPGTR